MPFTDLNPTPFSHLVGPANEAFEGKFTRASSPLRITRGEMDEGKRAERVGNRPIQASCSLGHPRLSNIPIGLCVSGPTIFNILDFGQTGRLISRSGPSLARGKPHPPLIPHPIVPGQAQSISNSGGQSVIHEKLHATLRGNSRSCTASAA